MNHRLTLAAAAAVILASVSEFSLISGAAWLVEAIGAVVVVALAGTLTRQSPVVAAVGATLAVGLASVPMLVAHSLYWKVLAVGLIAACAASATGLRPLRAVAGLATYLAALLLYLNALQAASRSFLAVIPTAASVRRLGSLVQQGSTATKYHPLVPATHGVLLLAAASIGLAAIVVDFLAVSWLPRATWPCWPPTAGTGCAAGAASSRSGTTPARTSASAVPTWALWPPPDGGSAWPPSARRWWRRCCCRA
jgi:hypothetical protein